MSVSPDQLDTIFRQLQEVFASHKEISIKPLKGNPPEQYEITYNIAGYTSATGKDPRLTKKHIVELAIPFGFPHFPPSCKPKSEIFHPDFDPAAICLGDFWQQKRQITDLIVFIGKLINGESYTTNNAFNEQAAVWYQQHSNKFPIANINWGEQLAGITESWQSMEKPLTDVLEDEDLSPDFSFASIEEPAIPENTLGEEEQLTLNTSFPPVASSSDVDLDLLRHLEKQKRFYKIRDIVGETGSFSEEVESIRDHANQVITKAEELHRSAKKSEYQENFQNSRDLYDLISSLVTDFPNIESDKKRVSKSLDNDERLEEPTPDLSDSFDDELEADDSNLLPETSLDNVATPRESPKFSTKTKDSFLSHTSINFRALLGLAGGFVAIFLIVCSVYLIISIYQLNSAENNLKICTNDLAKEEFESAQQACETALLNLSKIKYFKKDRIQEIDANIQEIVKSEALRQGLAGNLQVDGKFLPKKDAKILLAMKQHLKEGEDFFAQENWQESEEKYSKFMDLAGKYSSLVPSGTVEDIKGKLGYARFSISFHAANTLLNNHKWQEATVELKKAKAQLESLPEKDRKKYSGPLNSAIAKLNFEEFRKQGDDFFSKADWLNAISAYKSVLPSLQESDIAPQESIDTLKANINRAELYATIDKGNRASAEGAWDDAIQEYNKAIAILAASQSILKLNDTEITRKKIGRIILQTQIVRDKQLAKTLLDDKKDYSAAKNIYRQIVSNINNSGFSSEEEFADVKKETTVSIQNLDEKIYQADKEQHLKDNYRALFTENYPASVPEKLVNPVITFSKEIDNKLIFKMQCTETGRGRPLTLIMFYAYDKSSKKWSFYSEQH